ncbi:MAG TPA: hypothetical protein VGU25_08720 [Acidobacteriaceae bacterium]|nr:hypothetical protein [Acidobacteriaceae bacterium]
MLPLLARLSPNVALLIATLAVALIALELNRPGSILPGAAGLLLLLLAAASLWERQPSELATAGAIASIALLLLQARRPLHLSVIAALTALLIACFIRLIPRASTGRINAVTAVVCGTILGAGTTVLTRIARRARQNKGLD